MFNNLQSLFSWGAWKKLAFSLSLVTVCPTVVISLLGFCVWVCAHPVVLSSHWTWLNVFPHFLKDMTLVMLCLYETVHSVLLCGDCGVKSGSTFCTWRRVRLFSRLGVVLSVPLLKARTEYHWNRLINLFPFLCFVL